MTTAGWVFLVVSWLAILGLATFCFIRVLARKDPTDGEQGR